MPIVPRGTPIGRNVSRLRGMTIPTVEGRLKLGYLRGGVGLYLPIDPTVPNPVPVRPVVKGIGAFTRGRGLGGIAISGPSGPSTSFKVGDRWQISISGAAPNAGIGLNASVCSPDFTWCAEMPRSGQEDIAAELWTGTKQYGNSVLGTTDSAGNATMTGVFTSDQVGLWTQNWNVGGQLFGIQFTVADASGNATYRGPIVPGGVPYYQTLGQQPAITGQVPTPVVQNLDQQLAARYVTLAPTGQLIPKLTAVPAAPAASYANARVSFKNLTSGNASSLRVGDQWSITITGAAPNSPVSASSTMNGKSLGSASFGSTGSDGSFSTTGTLTPDTVGAWAETWSVGGVPVGSFSFNVSNAAGGGSGSGGGGSSITDLVSGVDLSSIPTWGWIAAAGVGALLIFGGHRN